MKKMKITTLGIVLFLSITAQAQISLRVNIGTPPPWGPVGYIEARYYYLPDVEAYYDVPSSMFIYSYGGAWVHRRYLPRKYRSYDLYSGYKVVMKDYHGDTPYNQFAEHKRLYAKGYHGEPQRSIGERPERGNHAGKDYHVNRKFKK